MTGPQAYQLDGELPSGTTVLEASAGTGKTFTIAALVARFVAEGQARLDELLIVTFSRAATGELRERVRERLASTAAALADPQTASKSSDPVDRVLASGPADEVAKRRDRLELALRSFDAATIATTHGFCGQVLNGLGVTADLAGGDRFVESLDDLVDEVVEDLYVRKFAAPPRPGESTVRPIPQEQARAIAKAVTGHEASARLEPRSAPADSGAGIRLRLAEAVRSEVARRKRRRGLRSYDDLQTDLASLLADPRTGPSARTRLRERYPVVLIDEFQDTDPVQWQIVLHAFVGQVRLVLIGDPKQAIYRFRGADVTAYLKAVESAERVATLECNWRSEQRLLDAFDVLFDECTFGDPKIRYRPVSAAHPEPQLDGGGAPLRLRWVARDTGLPVSGKGHLLTAELRPRVAADVAAEIVQLLESGARLRRPLLDPSWEPVEPGDIAVLVRTNQQAALVRDALLEREVPVVISGASSVFSTPAAQEWLVLLEALEQPHRAGRVRAAAMTCFIGWSAADLAAAQGRATDELSGLVRNWATVLAARGVAALLETITATQRLASRVLSAPDGERRMTDLRHIGEVLHAAATGEGLGITALVAWLRRRMTDAARAGEGLPERTRRLDSDAAAVQVMTIHSSKGLEFPVVHVPFAWDLKTWEIDQPCYHDGDGRRVLDISSRADGYDPALFNEGVRLAEQEEAAEQLRLLYVALTRARSRSVIWWAPATTAESAPLSRLLFGRVAGDSEPSLRVAVPADEEAAARFAELTARSPGLQVEAVGTPSAAPWKRTRPDHVDLAVAEFDRELDLAWRRTSYSALTAAAHDIGLAAEPTVGSEPEDAGLDDERDQPLLVGPEDAEEQAGLTGVVSPMAQLPGGTAFGSLVHGVFETVDTLAPDLGAEIAERVGEQLIRWGPGSSAAALDPALLTTALLEVYETPLGGAGSIVAGVRLRDIAPRNRLTELGFELPVAGGDQPGRDLRLGALGPLITRHLSGQQPADPLLAYGARLGDPVLRDQPLRGFLTGSIDVVLRVPADDGGPPRFVVVDYKTNWLGTAAPGSGELTAADYAPARLAGAMLGSDYPLQAMLYAVALHRYLRWRLPGYDPAAHLGGVLYLYVRGMCGPATPMPGGQPCGVFAWTPPPQLVVELSDLLDHPGAGS